MQWSLYPTAHGLTNPHKGVDSRPVHVASHPKSVVSLISYLSMHIINVTHSKQNRPVSQLCAAKRRQGTVA